MRCGSWILSLLTPRVERRGIEARLRLVVMVAENVDACLRARGDELKMANAVHWRLSGIVYRGWMAVFCERARSPG